MGFWKNMNTAFRGKKSEEEEAANTIATAPADIDNMRVGAYVTFGFLPLQENISGQTMEITATRVFKLLNGDSLRYAELDNGAFFIRKEGRNVEVLQEFEDNDAFLECVDDDFYEVLHLDDDEWEIQDGVEVITDNQTVFEMTEDHGWALTGKYRTIKDVKAAEHDGQTIRYIRAKSSNGKSFVSIFYDNGGDTFISGSCVLPTEDVEFNG